MACYSPIEGTRRKDGTIKFYGTKHVPPWQIEKVPCGQCIGCRLDYARQWATRCMLEAKDWEHNYALTLTYDNENVNKNEFINENTGEIISSMTLIPNDIKQFMKNLRKYWNKEHQHKGIRFFAVGEYGGKTERPHYHMIIYNLPINDLKLHCKTNTGYPLYNSEKVSARWGKGHVAINEISWDFCAYVARYITKKYKGQGAEEYYKSKMMIPEFTRMSLKPGIGGIYFQKNWEEIYKNDSIVIKMKDKAREVKPSKYYDNLFDRIDEKRLEEIKLDRKIKAKRRINKVLSSTSLTEEEYNELQRRSKEESAKLLIRPLEK